LSNKLNASCTSGISAGDAQICECLVEGLNTRFGNDRVKMIATHMSKY
jgi:hypothetical protein